MNRWTIILILIFGWNVGTQAQQKAYFFIVCKTNSDSLAKYAGEYEKLMASYIEREFPCARVRTQNYIRSKLEMERQNQLMGGETDWSTFCDDLKADYLINLEASEFLSSQIIVSASIIDYKKKESVARDSKYGSNNTGSLKKLFKEVTEKVVEKLADYEVCPYSGDVTIKIESEKDETKPTNAASPCGGNATINTEIKSNATLEWKLKKVKKIQTSGNVTYKMNETYTINSNFPCYICDNGMKGGVQIKETHETEAQTNGLSNDSFFEGKKIEDARISIKFMSDDTYSILIVGTSKKGPMKVTTEKEIKGICGSDSEPKDTKNKQIDIPLSIILGPYKGSSQDKTLSQKETKDLTIGQEKVTLTIDFSLTRN
jgi:hypothetical protein